MRRFSQLYAALDETNKTNDKVAALKDYFREAAAADAAWAVFLLSGRKLRQIIPVRRLCEWVIDEAAVPDWLFEECYEAVGDLAETASLLLPPAAATLDSPLAQLIEEQLVPLRDAESSVQKETMRQLWRSTSETQRLVLHKLITGAFRVGVSQRLVVRALSQITQVASEVVAHRLMGDWMPSARFYDQLVSTETSDAAASQPYPFFLAHPLEVEPDTLGEVADWQAEWKWDGIRAQLIRRRGETYIWSRGDELMTDRFPEVLEEAERLPDGTVLDGEILAWRNGVLPFSVMQKRIGRKTLGKKILSEAPVALMAFDLLEHQGDDVRKKPLDWRRGALQTLLDAHRENHPEANGSLLLSRLVRADSWEQYARIRETSREQNTEGLMLKRRSSAYGVGRPRGDWWKWKINPFTIDAVLIYAQRGSGRRASLYTDYTFAVWDEDRLVPFAKAYSGLTDAEIAEVDAFVRRNTLERFGPVRSVKPELVFEIAFENIQYSKRHKSGIAVRFPRIARWRRDKNSESADTLQTLKSMTKPA